jgi:hypothetical protein
MAIKTTMKYTKMFHPKAPPKYTQIVIFGMKIYHLATLISARKLSIFFQINVMIICLCAKIAIAMF